MAELTYLYEVLAAAFASIVDGLANGLLSWGGDAAKMIVPFALGLYAEPLKQRVAGARLGIEIGRGPTYISTNREVSSDGRAVEAVGGGTASTRLVRVCVRNHRRSVAKNCRAYLVSIEKDTGHGFQLVSYNDTLQLKWSCRDKGEDSFIGVDLPMNVSQCVDVVATFSDLRRPYLYPQVRVLPDRYREIFAGPGQFRLGICIAGDGCTPVRRSIVVKWDGDWASLE